MAEIVAPVFDQCLRARKYIAIEEATTVNIKLAFTESRIDKFIILKDDCDDCGECVKVCPVSAIVREERV